MIVRGTATVQTQTGQAQRDFDFRLDSKTVFGTMGLFPASQCALFGAQWRGQYNLLNSNGTYRTDTLSGQLAPLAPYIGQGLQIEQVVRHSAAQGEQERPMLDKPGCRAALRRLFVTLPTGSSIVVSNEPTIEWPDAESGKWVEWCKVVVEEAHRFGFSVGAPGQLYQATKAIALHDNPTAEARGRVYLEGAREAQVDRYTIHTYEDDMSVFEAVVEGSRREWGGVVEINEMGNRVPETDVVTGPATCRAVVNLGLPKALWYPSGKGANTPTRLMTATGALTPAGQAIVDCLAGL